MKVILQEEVKSLGRAGTVLDVKDGYARNFLLPRRLAVAATVVNMKSVEVLQRSLTAKEAEGRTGAEQLAQRIHELSVSIPVQVGEEGKLFGSVTSKDIVSALEEQGIAVEKRAVDLESPIKQLGEYAVTVHLHPSVSAPLRVKVVPEEAEATAQKKSRRAKTT